MLGYRIKQDRSGGWYAVIESLGNHEQIWRTGDSYVNRSDAEGAVELLRKAGMDILDLDASNDPTQTRDAAPGDDDDGDRDAEGNTLN